MNTNYGWMNNTALLDNRYQYNGKEWNDDFGLNWSDYGARWYDAAVGRFPSVDPIIDKFPYLTPYNYASNSPVAKIDLYGLQGRFFHELKEAATAAVGATLGTITAIVEDATGADLSSPDAGTTFGDAFQTGEQMGHIGMLVTGVMETGGGVALTGVGGALTVTGAGAKVGIPAAAVGAGMAVHGAFTMNNALRNMSKNNNDRKNKSSVGNSDSSKNEKHGDGGKAKTKSEKHIEKLQEDVKNAPNKKERQKIEKKIENIQKTAQKKAKGEEHSRKKKQ